MQKNLLSSIQHSNKISSDNFNQQVQLSNDILNLQQQLQTRIYAPKGQSLYFTFPSKSHTEIMQINSDERIIRAKINESQLKQLKIINLFKFLLKILGNLKEKFYLFLLFLIKLRHLPLFIT